MQPDDRLVVLYVWNGLVVFASLLFLTGELFKSALVAIFVLVSTLLEFGQLWLLRGGLLVSAVALLVYVGLIPHPSQWSDSFRDVCGRFYRVEPLAAQWRSSLEEPFRVTFSYTR
jgi:hypothetical protein